MDRGQPMSRSLSSNGSSVAKRLKILMLGDSGVGKSSLVMRWTQDTFSPSLTSTVGVNFKSKKVTIRGEPFQIQVWDTAGQEHFHKITTSYYKGAHGIMLVYDVSDQKSADSVEYWVKNIRSHASENVQLALIGNKIDLRSETNKESEERRIGGGGGGGSLTPPPSPKQYLSSDFGRALSSRYEVAFFETSAKDSSNVNDAYSTLVEQIVEFSSTSPILRRPLSGVVADGNKKSGKDPRKQSKEWHMAVAAGISSSIESHASDSTSSETKREDRNKSGGGGGGGLFASIRKPEHRRHSSASAMMHSLAAKSGLPVNISGGDGSAASSYPPTPHGEEKEKCCVS